MKTTLKKFFNEWENGFIQSLGETTNHFISEVKGKFYLEDLGLLENKFEDFLWSKIISDDYEELCDWYIQLVQDFNGELSVIIHDSFFYRNEEKNLKYCLKELQVHYYMYYFERDKELVADILTIDYIKKILKQEQLEDLEFCMESEEIIKHFEKLMNYDKNVDFYDFVYDFLFELVKHNTQNKDMYLLLTDEDKPFFFNINEIRRIKKTDNEDYVLMCFYDSSAKKLYIDSYHNFIDYLFEKKDKETIERLILK